MSTNFSPVETDVPRLRCQFRSSCKQLLNLFRDTEISLPFTPEPPRTPISSLTRGFTNVSTLAGDTPRCRLDLSNLSNGEEETAFNFSQSSGSLEGQKDSAELQDNLDSRRQCAQLFQTKVLCSTPGTPGIIHRVNWEINSPSMNKENDGSFFKYPGWQIPRSLLFWKRPPDSQLTRCAAVQERRSLEEYEMKDLGSPIAAAAAQSMPEALDGFPELYPEERKESEVVLLKKTASFSDVEIVRALDQDFGRRQLVGDFSNVFALPTVMGRHEDLRYITSQTMAALLHDQFQSLIEKFCIIDCRYPYEYRGGHIKGALNIHRQDDLLEHFLKKPVLPSAPQKRLILVFHCEFSSERGPKMCRYLREEDRAMNEYPALLYPELYVLQGGYKDFFLEYKELCEPQSYCPMHHQDFKAEMLKFWVKSKTWAGQRKRRDQIAHLMKP